MTPFKIHLTNISKTSLKHYIFFFFSSFFCFFKNNERPVLPEITATNNRNLTRATEECI